MDAQTLARALALLTFAAPFALSGCAGDDDAPGTEGQNSDEQSPDTSTEPDYEDAEDAAGPGEDGPEDADDLPDQESADVERTDELGGFFSEEEACMAIGSTVDGLHEDMEGGLESEEDLDGAHEAVTQTYALAPDELHTPLGSIAELLDVEYGELEAGAVLEELAPLEEWVDTTCDGEYYQQDHEQ